MAKKKDKAPKEPKLTKKGNQRKDAIRMTDASLLDGTHGRGGKLLYAFRVALSKGRPEGFAGSALAGRTKGQISGIYFIRAKMLLRNNADQVDPIASVVNANKSSLTKDARWDSGSKAIVDAITATKSVGGGGGGHTGPRNKGLDNASDIDF